MWAGAVSEEGCQGEKDKERKISSLPSQSNRVLHQPSRLANRQPESITLSSRRPRWRELHHPTRAVLSGAALERWSPLTMLFYKSDRSGMCLPPPSLVYSRYSITKRGVGGTYFLPTLYPSAVPFTPSNLWKAMGKVLSQMFFNGMLSISFHLPANNIISFFFVVE